MIENTLPLPPNLSAKIALAGPLLLLAAASASATPRHVSTNRLGAATEEAEARRIIRASLLDPTSVQFTIAAIKTGRDPTGAPTAILCGSYNARNRFGGYVGAIPFAYTPALHAVFTAQVARLNADGSSISLQGFSQQLDRTTDMAEISALAARGRELQGDVTFWLHQC